MKKRENERKTMKGEKIKKEREKRSAREQQLKREIGRARREQLHNALENRRIGRIGRGDGERKRGNGGIG